MIYILRAPYCALDLDSDETLLMMMMSVFIAVLRSLVSTRGKKGNS